MSEQLIDQYVDRAAVAGDTQFLKDHLKEVLALFDKVNNTKITLGGSYNIKDLTAGSKELKDNMNALFQENQRLKTAFDEVAAKLEALTKKKKDSNDPEKDGTNAAAKSQQKLLYLYTEDAEAQIASTEAARKRTAELKNQNREQQAAEGSIEQLRAQLIRLNKEYDNLSATDRGSEAGQQLRDQIKGISDNLKKLEGETGRFQRDVGNYGGSAKIIVDALEKYRQKSEQLTKTLGAGHPAAEQARKDFEELRKVTDNPKFLTVAANYGDAIQETRFFQKELINLEARGMGNSEVASELRQRLAELTDQIGDTRAEIKALSSDTRSFDLFASAVSFLASSFQAAAGAAVALGASEEDAAEATKNLAAIENVANGVRGIANELTTKGTAANKLYSFVQNQVAIAMDTTATASSRLKAGLASLGIGLLIVGIGLLVGNFNKLKELMSLVSKQQRILNDLNKQAVEGYVKEKVAVGLLVEEVKAENTSKQRKKEIIDELNEISPVYFGGIKTEKDLIEKLPAAYAKYTEALVLSAKVKAAEALLQENEQKRLLNILDKEEKLALRRKQLASLPSNLQNQDPVIKELTDDIADLNKEANDTGGIITKFVLDTKKQLNSIGGDVSGNSHKAAEELLQDLFEASRKHINNQAELDKDAANRRLTALKKTFEERKILEGEFLRQGQKELRAIRDADFAVIQTNLDLQLAAAADNLVKRKSAEDDAHTARILAERDFQDKVTELVREAEQRRRKIISSTIQGLVEVVSPELSKMAQALDKITGHGTVERLEAWVQAFKEAKDSIVNDIKDLEKHFSGQILTAFETLVGFTFENEKNAIQDQIDKLEEKKEKELEVANATILNEEDKAARITSIEITAQAEREKLERQQRQVDIQKAKFEKAAAILQITIDTIQKVAAIKAQASVLLSNPLTAPLAPLALAQIPIVIGSGAVSAALIAAKPIPKFRKGRKGGDATIGWVGDGGKHEVMYSQDLKEAYVTPKTDTLAYIPKGYGVAPSIEDFKAIALAAAHRSSPVIHSMPASNDTGDLMKATNKEIHGLKMAYLNRAEQHITITEAGMKRMQKKGSSWMNYIQNNI